MTTPTPVGAWWTPAIVDQIRTMRTTQNYSTAAQRKLAALLQTAECPHAETVNNLARGVPQWTAAVQICSLLGGEYEAAADYLGHIADEIEQKRVRNDFLEQYQPEDDDTDWPDGPPAGYDAGGPKYTLDWFVGQLYQSTETGGEHYHTFNGFNVPSVLSEDRDKIWAAFETLTGMSREARTKGRKYADSFPFSCSC